jgi:branched-chain amino acid transport system permease protein
MWNGSAQPTAFATFGGLVWLAVLVTIGIRSITAAALAGLAFTMLPNVFSTYLPSSPKWAEVPALLFGLGAIGLAANPEGVVAQNARYLERLVIKVIGQGKSAPPGLAERTGTSGVIELSDADSTLTGKGAEG